jgi:hypothetical protein
MYDSLLRVINSFYLRVVVPVSWEETDKKKKKKEKRNMYLYIRVQDTY